MIDENEMILNISKYTVPLSEVQLTCAVFYHEYIVLNTSHHHWSIEKNSEGITIQRSEKCKAVVNNYRQEKRCKTEYWEPELIIQDKGRLTMTEVVNFLHSKDFLNQKYSLASSYCKDFAKAFFDEVIFFN